MHCTKSRCAASQLAVVVRSQLRFFRLAIIALIVLLSGASRAQSALVIGSFDVPRGGIDSLADAPQQAQARAFIQSYRPDVSFQSTGTLTPGFLAGVNVLVIGDQTGLITAITPLSPSEQTAMANFVMAGGNVAIFTDNQQLDPAIGDASRASLLSPFGLQTTGVSLAPSATVIDPTHPIADGPFGTLTQISLSHSGWFSDLGPYAHAVANENAFNMPMLAAIERGAISPTSGRVVFVADSNVFDPPFASGPVLLGNLTAYLVPEPASLVQMALGLGVLVFAGARHRGKRAAG